MWLGLAGPATRPDQTVQEISAGQCNPDERSGIFAVIYCSMSPLLPMLCSNEEWEIEMKSNFKLFFLSYEILFLSSILRSPMIVLDSYHLSLSQHLSHVQYFHQMGRASWLQGPNPELSLLSFQKNVRYVLCM